MRKRSLWKFYIAAMACLLSGCSGAKHPQQDQANPQPPADQLAELRLAEAVDLSLAGGLQLQLGDLNADGRTDLILPMLGSGLYAVYNNSKAGQLDFGAAQEVVSGDSQISSAAVSDMNADTRPDLAVLSTFNGMQLWQQDESGRFNLFATNEYFRGDQLLTDTVNSDDDNPDILLAGHNPGGLSALYLTAAMEPFYPAPQAVSTGVMMPVDSTYSQAIIGDIEGTGLNDVVLLDTAHCMIQTYMHVSQPHLPAEKWDPELMTYVPRPADEQWPEYTTRYGYSESQLPSAGPEPTSPERASIGDIDHDGIADLIVLGKLLDSGTAANEAVEYDDPAVAIESHHSYLIFIRKCQIEDEDGQQTWQTEARMDRMASYTDETVLQFPDWIRDIKLADMNSDGELDVVGVAEMRTVGYSRLFCFFGKGDFTFSELRTFDLDNRPSGVAVVDLDGDGLLDIVVLQPASGLAVYRNEGNSESGSIGHALDFSKQ